MPRKHPQRLELERIAKSLPKARPLKAYELLHRAFAIYAAAADVARAAAVVGWIYAPGRPPPSEKIHALGTWPMDAFLLAAGLSDLTRGVPHASGHHPAPPLAPGADLATRVAYGADEVRWRVTMDAYTQFPPPTAQWSTLEGRELWRAVQRLARAGQEAEAHRALSAYLQAWSTRPEGSGAGYGNEIVLGLDLALQHEGGRVPPWFPALRSHFVSNFVEASCVPRIARALVGGVLGDSIGLSEEDRGATFEALATALGEATTTSSTPTVQKAMPIERSIDCSYAQLHLEHETSRQTTPYFEDARESAQGMSIFADRVAIGTPAETESCAVTITVANEAPKVPSDAVQAVVFPLEVTGPLVLRSVDSTAADEDPFAIAHGGYDVWVLFRPRRAKGRARTAPRRFDVTMTFCPRTGSAPRCLKIAEGAAPSTIFVRG